MTPLHVAASAGYNAVVEVLLALGADINAQIYGWMSQDSMFMPLHLATAKGHESTARLLLGKGANKHLRGVDGRTAFEAARNAGHQICA